MLKSNGRTSGITIGAPTCHIDGEDSSATNAWICDVSGEIIVDYTTKPKEQSTKIEGCLDNPEFIGFN